MRVTPDLDARWRSGEAPFDGRIVVTADDPELAELLGMLNLVAESLRRDYTDLLTYRDWHEHDGYLTSPRPFEWSTLEAALDSTEALYSARDQDEFVRVAIYPPTFDWLLRFSIDDADSSLLADAWCDFDFSCTPRSPSDELLDKIHSTWPGYTAVVLAREYFNASYAG